MTSLLVSPIVSDLKIEKYALTVQLFGEPLAATMNKYTRPNAYQAANSPGAILMLAHGVGFFKEMWEPIIDDIFRLDNGNSPATLIREIWALDCPNHGEACTMNEDILVRSPSRLNLWDYAEAFASLYKSGLLGRLDDRRNRVILCGHSAGAAAVVLATSFFKSSPRLPFSSMILVDPAMWTRQWHGKENDMYKMIERTTPIRRDIWRSKDEASEWLERTIARRWDKRIFSKYIEHGVRLLPTAFYPDRRGATLTTHRLAENFSFPEAPRACVYEAVDRLGEICGNIPVHLVYGSQNDMFDRDLQDSLTSPACGRSMASIKRIEGAGHLVAQERPAEVAKCIVDILHGHQSKLSNML